MPVVGRFLRHARIQPTLPSCLAPGVDDDEVVSDLRVNAFQGEDAQAEPAQQAAASGSETDSDARRALELQAVVRLIGPA